MEKVKASDLYHVLDLDNTAEVNKISETRTNFDNDLAKVTDLKSLEELRIKYLSRKGSVSVLVDEFKDVPREEKKNVGQALNEMKIHLQDSFNSLKEKLPYTSIE